MEVLHPPSKTLEGEFVSWSPGTSASLLRRCISASRKYRNHGIQYIHPFISILRMNMYNSLQDHLTTNDTEYYLCGGATRANQNRGIEVKVIVLG